MDLGEIRRVCVDWIGLVRNTDKWQALVNAVMSLQVPHEMLECSQVVAKLVTSQVMLSSCHKMVLVAIFSILKDMSKSPGIPLFTLKY
jgi:hypothetical protein